MSGFDISDDLFIAPFWLLSPETGFAVDIVGSVEGVSQLSVMHGGWENVSTE